MKKKCKMVYIKGIPVGVRKSQSYPLGLISIRNYVYKDEFLKNNLNIDIDVFDFYEEDEKILLNYYNDKPDVIAFSCYIWNYNRILELSRKLKLVLTDTLILFGGPQIQDSKKVLESQSHVDIVSVGEGEITLKNVFYSMFEKIKISDIKGITYRYQGNIIDNGKNEIIDNLDDIPSLIEDEYMYENKIALYETSRGCPFGCKYCCWSERRMRYYSLERVEADLKRIFSYEHIEQLFLIDSELDIDINRAKEVIKLVIKYNTRNILVQGFLGLHKVDMELLKLCKIANFRFGIGIQSTNIETLNNCGRTWFNKDVMEDTIKNVLKFYDKNLLELQLIIGLPGDNLEKFKRSLQWCLKLDIRKITANRLIVFPGTYFYNNKDEFGIVFDNEPYNLIYQNSTYSYEEIIKSEALFRGLTFILSLLSPKEIREISTVIDIWVILDGFAENIIKNGLCFDKRQEYDLPSKDSHVRLVKSLLDTIEEIDIKNDFKMHLKLFFTNKYEYFLFKSNIREGILGKKFIYYRNVKIEGSNLVSNKNTLTFCIYNQSKNIIKSLTLNNEVSEIFKELLENHYSNNKVCTKSNNTEIKSKILEYLIQNNYIS
ncbi:B12-binding domain-containing radical SAM protein [Clostridium sp. D2Q-14]|uniref:B12-binding domain-containing radical SAM protein n=1 Tax=Anaeromonas gelatinilytica TaxID=2683194 RepID=UPI00193B7804|nr:radical SAM protein [Anaeromonas gelatinilytica]MBS4535040.1 B12-binding domain-containing radical SAM protein [Anaeromonas gelatinilytica]